MLSNKHFQGLLSIIIHDHPKLSSRVNYSFSMPLSWSNGSDHPWSILTIIHFNHHSHDPFSLSSLSLTSIALSINYHPLSLSSPLIIIPLSLSSMMSSMNDVIRDPSSSLTARLHCAFLGPKPRIEAMRPPSTDDWGSRNDQNRLTTN